MTKKLFKVLSADDEYWGRENIRNLIPWGDYGIDFLEPACDGDEVLERIEEEKPDILLTDINMPFVNGIELLKKLNRTHPDLITIAISGYDDFEKVKGVFTLGGMDYLLKPVGKEELVDVVSKALKKIETREAERKKSMKDHRQQYKMSSYLEDTEYSAVLNSKLYGEGQRSYIVSKNTFSEMAMLLLKFYDIESISRKYGNDVLQMSCSIKELIREKLRDDTAIVFNYNAKMTEYLVAMPAGRQSISHLAKRLMDSFPLSVYGPVSIVLHEKLCSLDEIGQVYRDMIAMLVTRPFDKCHYIIKCEEQNQVPEFNQRMTDHFETELELQLETKQREAIKKLIFISSGLSDSRKNGWSYIEMRQYIIQLRGILFRYLCQRMPQKMSEAEDVMESVERSISQLDYDGVIEALDALIDSFWDEEELATSGSMNAQAAYVHEYIRKNFSKNITLSTLSEKYHVEPGYLSRVFSRNYGETITSYLTRMRIEHAKEMMREEDKKLETISFLVGYDDYNYFSRVFRKRVGVSPSEYRKTLRK